MSDEKKPVDPDALIKALDSATKAEVLKNALAKAAPPKPSSGVKPHPVEMKISADPLTTENRLAHLASIESAIRWIEAEKSKVAGSMHPQTPQLLVQLDYALDWAESTQEALIKMESKPKHGKAAQEGLDFLRTFELKV